MKKTLLVVVLALACSQTHAQVLRPTVVPTQLRENTEAMRNYMVAVEGIAAKMVDARYLEVADKDDFAQFLFLANITDTPLCKEALIPFAAVDTLEPLNKKLRLLVLDRHVKIDEIYKNENVIRRPGQPFTTPEGITSSLSSFQVKLMQARAKHYFGDSTAGYWNKVPDGLAADARYPYPCQ